MRVKPFPVFLFLFVAAVAVLRPCSAGAASPAITPPIPVSVLSSLTPEEVRILKNAYQSGEITPDVRRVLDAHPELLSLLPAGIAELLAAEAETGGVQEEPLDNTAKRVRRRKTLSGARTPLAEQPEVAPYDWRTSVYVSRLFTSRLRKQEVAELTHFGHALFDPQMEVSPMGDYYPVPDEYVIGPGDEVVVQLWGRMEGVHRMQVDRNGKIFFPKFGSFYVAGKSFGEVKEMLRGKTGSVAEVYSDVSAGRLKGFLVSVLGEVESPGRQLVTPFHTVFQAITAAGGIRDIGSLRGVQVKRGTETVAEVDIYEFLLRGDVTRDVRLRAGDVVFVPVAGPLVAVAGEVRRQAIYELKSERTIGEVLEMAGGVSPSAYKRRIQVERLDGNRARIVLDLNLEEAGDSLSSVHLQDGDILRVLAVLPEDENAVAVEGNIHRPGKYEWRPGLTVGSLIPDEKFFLPDTFLDYALLTRLVGPERRKEAIAVNLRRIVVDRDPQADVALQPRDSLTVYSKTAFRDRKTARIGGEVRNPGEHEILPGMRVSDLVKLGGDLNRNASLEEAELSRRDENRRTLLLKIDLGKALSGDEEHNLLLQDRDVLMIRPVPDLQEVRYITVSGEVRSPGIYAARKDERLTSILERAGGFTPDAFLKGAVYTRVSVQKRQQELIDRTVEQLEQDVARTAAKEGATALDSEDILAQKQIFEARKTLLARLKQTRAQGRVIIRLAEPEKLKGTMDDLLVEDGDSLTIPREAEVVNVLGRVYNPTAVVYRTSRDTAGYYLRKVGGPTEDADRDHIFVVKADGSVVTKGSSGEQLWFFGSGDILETPVEPGDAIVVPEKLVFTRLMKDVKDITQILYQIAVTAGVLIVAF